MDSTMYCKIGNFHWNKDIDVHCPNHPPGTKKNLPNGKVVEIVDCSEEDPYWQPPNWLPGYAELMGYLIREQNK